MFNHFSARLSLLVLFALLVSPLAAYGYSGGNGSAGNPHLIANADDWLELSETSADWGKHFKMTGDVDLGAEVWPVGNGTTAFTGSLDGNNFRLWDASVSDSESFGGLFGVMSGDAEIKNLGVTGCIMKGSVAVGGLVGKMEGGRIQDCYVINDVTPDTNIPAGGLVGMMSGGVIKNCYAAGAVVRYTNSGGLIGARTEGEVIRSYWDIDESGQAESAGGEGMISVAMKYPHGSFVYAGWGKGWHSDSSGSINAGYPYRSNSSSNYSGGNGSSADPYVIAGAWDWVNFCSALNLTNKHFILAADLDLIDLNLSPVGAAMNGVSNLTFNGQGHALRNVVIEEAGDHTGIFGDLRSSVIKNLYGESIRIQGQDYTGGFIGKAFDTLVASCAVRGEVQGQSYTGGFIGSSNQSTITNCFSRVAVTGTYYVAGFVAELIGSGPNIRDNYSAGAVSANDGSVFGFSPASTQVQDCYWDVDSSGVGIGTGGGEGRTTESMTAPYGVDTYESWDFNSNEEWTHDFFALSNDGYPLPQTLLHFSNRYSGGSGSYGDPYLISTLGDWVQLMTSRDDWEDLYFELTTDLDFQGYDLVPIGVESEPFAGVFDGRSHTVSNGRIYLPDEEYVGLFGNLQGDGNTTGVVQDLVVEDFSVTGGEKVGILAGYAIGLIQRCEVSGDVAGESAVGGLCGNSRAVIKYSSFGGTVTAWDSKAGGLCGEQLLMKVESCRVDALVQGKDHTGGLVGRTFHAEIEKCHVDGEVTGENYTGGLVGEFSVSGNNIQVVTLSSSTATVTGQECVGGIIGKGNYAALSNSYAAGDVTGATEVGGFAGRLDNSQTFRCYARGVVVGGYPVGGFVGAADDSIGGPSSFWDFDASGQYSSAYGTGKNTAAMTWPYSDPTIWDSWDFDGAWIHDMWGKANDGYPQLRDRFFAVKPGYSGGSGTEEDPFIIDHAGDWLVLANTPIHWGSHFKLEDDIDFQGAEVPVIGSIAPVYVPFTGSFESNGMAFSNGNINGSGEGTGLFNVVAGPGTIAGISLYNFAVKGEDNVGALVGKLSGGTVEGCSVSGTVEGKETVGGLVGLAEGGSLISQGFSVVEVKGETVVGGLVGKITDSRVAYVDVEGTVDSSVSRGGGFVGYGENSTFLNDGADVVVTGKAYLGGFAGILSGGDVEGGTASGDVDGNRDYPSYLGGFAGSLEEEVVVRNSRAYGNVEGDASHSGGFLGYGTARILVEACAAHGSVEGGENTGGFAGYLMEECRIDNCSAGGQVTGGDSTGGFVGAGLEDIVLDQCSSTGDVDGQERVGGFAGHVYETELSNCSSTGAVKGTNYVGGFLGEVSSTSSALTACEASGAVEGRERVGGFIGNLKDAPVTECHASGAVEGRKFTGGFAGFIRDTTVQNCSAEGLVKGVGGSPESTGGFAGTVEYESKLLSCQASGNVSGKDDVGGFVGNAVGSNDRYLDFEACQALGSVRGESNVGGFGGNIREGATVKTSHAAGAVEGLDNTGGFVGRIFEGGEISYNHALGSVEGKTATGGFVGTVEAGGEFQYCFTLGDVEGTTDTGGFAGRMYQAEVECCYTRGAVKGNTGTGGFAAKSQQTILLDNCYAAGAVSGDGSAGGLVKEADGLITHCYWDRDLSGLSWSAAGTGLASAEMRFPATEFFEGWDFGQDWRVDYANENDGYPVLREEGEQYSGGTGAADNPFQLLLPGDWAQFAASPGDWDKHFKLTIDLDFEGQPFTPIGNGTTAFTGSFDGQDHVIRNVSLGDNANSEQGDDRGIFGHVGSGGTISKLHGVAIQIAGRDRVGGLVGFLQGTLSGCTLVDSHVEGRNKVGGLVGHAENPALIVQSACIAEVEASGAEAGGMAGYSDSSTFKEVWAGGSVIAQGDTAGGLVGYGEYFAIEDAYAAVAVSAADRVGGLVGHASEGEIKRAYAIGVVSVSGKAGTLAGGLMGFNATNIIPENSYWNRESTGQDGSVAAGRRTTEQMTGADAQQNYRNWDFDTIWAMPEGIRRNQGYPYLRGVAEELALQSWHPADFDRNWHLEDEEAEGHVERWQQGSASLAAAIRSLYIKSFGGYYGMDEEKPVPECWVPVE